MKGAAAALSSIASKHFWVPLTIATLLALVAPPAAAGLGGLITPVLMVMFFLVCLGVDFMEVAQAIRRPGFVAYVLVIYLVVVPAVLYGVLSVFSRDVAVGVLLLAAMPPGMAAPVFTGMMRGRVPLALTLTLACTVVCPFTVFMLFSLLTDQAVYVDPRELGLTILLINLVPLAAAHVMRRWPRAASFVAGARTHAGALTLLCLCFIVYVAIAQHAAAITADPLRAATDLLWLYGVFVLLHLVGYWTAPWRPVPDRIALTVASGYMNNALAIGLAVTFFSPRVAFLVALSEVPWNTLPGVLKYALRRVGSERRPAA